VGAFYRTVLTRGICTSRSDGIVEFLGKEVANSRIMVQFATLVQNDILVIGSWGMAVEPRTKPVGGTALGDPSGTVEGTGRVICDHNVARFPIQAKEGSRTGFVFGLLSGKSKINGEALEWDGGGTSGVVACSAFRQFCRKANGTLIEDRVNVFESRHPINVMVCIVQVAITGMAKALVPEKMFGADAQFVKVKFLGDGMESGDDEGRVIDGS
jgi:hypothetical protein